MTWGNARDVSDMTSRFKVEEGWFTVFLVWLLVTIVGLAILEAELLEGLEVVPVVGTFGILVGLALAKSRFRGRTAHLFALLYGIFLVTFLVGRSLPEPLTWQERIFELVERQADWLRKAFSEGSSRDGLVFVLHTGGIFWLLGYTASWYTFREPRLWRVVLPSGLVLLSVVYYYYGPRPLAIFLALYALVALIYIARTHLVAQEREWRLSAVRYERDIRYNFLQASFAIAVLALAVAWGLPTAQASTAVSNVLGESGVSDTWHGFQDNWTRLFSSLRSYGTGTTDAFRDSLSLGGPRSVSNSLIMDVYVAERLPFVYWEAAVYDHYEDGSWSVSESDQQLHFPDDGQIDIAEAGLRREVLQTFINYVPNSGTIHGAPAIVNSDRQMFVIFALDGDGKTEVHGTQSRFVMRQGERYQVVSRYSIADATSLRAAQQEYPQWLREKYLQLPESITPQTVALAAELTAGYDNPFDKALAVRDYLRRNITYNDQIPAPPEGVEPVHYVLFDRNEGYCNYYASAMVVMLRSQGIPARFVGGYAQGEWDDDTGSYRVRASNSHTWVEVYFPAYGWIQFEPTASQPSNDRPEGSGNPGDPFAALQSPNEDLSLTEPESDIERFGDVLAEEGGTRDPNLTASGVSPLQIFSGVLLVGVAGVLVFAGSRFNRRVEGDVERSYGRLESWARLLGIFYRPAHTPYERATLLGAAVPEGREPLRNLTHQYVRQRFSPARTVEEGFEPLAEWRLLRPLLIRQAILKRLSRKKKSAT
jgi:hypothetical protein